MSTQLDKDQHTVAMRLTLVIQAVLVIGLGLFMWRGDWENVFLTAVVVALTLSPALLKRYRIILPPDFQLMAAAFVFLTLFLGSARDFYYKYWWWDIVLHAGSGFLLGVIGFLAVFLLNETDHIPRGMKPRFVCLFAVTFAVTMGVVWEIFEFAVDTLAPSINMQSGETGVNDTMQDLMVDMAGAIVVAAMGWGYVRSGRWSFIADAVRSFVRRNPRLFGRR